jgi:hypothetical protein
MIQEEAKVPQSQEDRSAQSNDYISLTSIRGAILDFFRFIFKCFDLLFLSIRKRPGLFLVCCFIGLLGSAIYRYLVPKYNSTEMIVYYNDLSKKDYYEIINNLNSLLYTESYPALSRELKISNQEAKSIKGIEALDLNGETLKKDTSAKVGQRFKIQLRLKELIDARPYQDAILNYLNNNPYLKQLKEGQKAIFAEKLEFITREQQRLDSLKVFYNNNLGSARMPATFYNNELNPADIYVQSNNLANQKESILSWLHNQAVPVMLVDGFKTPRPSEVLAFRYLLAIGLACGMVLGLIVCLLASVKDAVRK